LLGIVDRRTRLLHDRVRAGTIETRAMTNIRPLTDQVPLNVDDWAIPAETCERLVHEIMTRRPRTILECGSGTSTVVMAACLRSFGIDGHIYSLDHESTYAERTRLQLGLAGLTDYATVITAPLTPHAVDGRSIRWYDFDPSEYLDQPIELLFVDGPPWDTDHLARLPAVPV
jgi:predicted O-methyltransferase YrrM